MSPRNFARVFSHELGSTPARYVEQARVEAARTQLASTDDGVDQIARGCGFSSAELLRRSFLRHFKVAPSQYRKHFSGCGVARDGRVARTTTSRPPG
jgi:transcriptional regulator GlxA family with amidase domain